MKREPSERSSRPIPSLSLLDITILCQDERKLYSQQCEHYSIWWIKPCGANLEIDGEMHAIGPGGCVIIPPRTAVRLQPDVSMDGKLEVYDFRFTANEAAAALIGQALMVFSACAEWAAGIGVLLDQWEAVDGLVLLRLQARFQELAVLLLEQRQACTPLGVEREVEETIHYLNREYAKDIRIEKLAERTALSRWKYNDMFKAMTGKTPVQYLTELRIDRAKQLLVGSGQRLKEIAEQTGFRDEYYFSRRFKQSVGVSPTRFVRIQSRAARICSLHSLGDLLPLGIVPIGTDRNLAEQGCAETRNIQSMEEPLDMEKLLALQPDLIVCPSYMPRQHYDCLAAIAPTALWDWQDDIYVRLGKLGRLLGRSAKAKEWIETYRNKALSARRKLEAYVQPGESAAAFVYCRKGLYVYGGHNFGHTLYEGLGFVPPDPVRTLMAKEKPLKWRKISPEDLPLYAGDRVFMAVENQDRSSRPFLEMLKSETWNRLQAVVNQRVYIVERRWGLYDALTLERHLDEMLLLLTR
ncbi:HTH-type transcriptional activator RhaS [Paenibacillus solanacearum]|uniref:HTH-type transcriptional activator RhaS n=1 Tax=Paenibacillus solanacearum TaxID=2048548 RepID=A0A916K951_9BACL|nr:helix-turn-helix domain-containing protein [Paenibacillus solanacearum]CAG7651319.1 HTH-type transcriptional activator RhaS [Paenibacillus solanacearum]